MATNQDVLKALTTLEGRLRDDFRHDLREEFRGFRAEMNERFDAIHARFDRLEAGYMEAGPTRR